MYALNKTNSSVNDISVANRRHELELMKEEKLPNFNQGEILAIKEAKDEETPSRHGTQDRLGYQ